MSQNKEKEEGLNQSPEPFPKPTRPILRKVSSLACLLQTQLCHETKAREEEKESKSQGSKGTTELKPEGGLSRCTRSTEVCTDDKEREDALNGNRIFLG